MALRGRQQRFVNEYLIDRNGARAYIRAGYKVKNEDVAAVMASRLLRDDKVKKAIEAGEAELAERNKITQDKVLNR
ncbi:TPA: terminase small subunit, partial [Acinetobacter baumannii]